MDINDPQNFINLEQSKQGAVLNWIEKRFIKTKKANSDHTSYSLKHVFEDETGIYLTNGEFKGAMLKSGIETSKSSVGYINWKYKAKLIAIN